MIQFLKGMFAEPKMPYWQARREAIEEVATKGQLEKIKDRFLGYSGPYAQAYAAEDVLGKKQIEKVKKLFYEKVGQSDPDKE